MEHLLDNPVWNALVSGNKNLADGTEHFKCFPASVAPFTGLKKINAITFNSLFDFIPEGRKIAIVTPRDIEIPAQWKSMQHMNVLQMVAENGVLKSSAANHPLHRLTTDDVPQMLELTKLTNPGPFFERTIELGNYFGIINSGRLVAMTGQRFHPGSYIEVSAVCTHPEHHGNGYATALMVHVARLITLQSCTPFLHVLTNNITAIKHVSSGFE